MALSGSVTTGECEGRSVTLNWSASQDIASNSSTISWSLVGSGSAGGWVRVSELSAYINGSQVFYRNSSHPTDCYPGTVLGSGSTVIYHNSDGTKTFSASVSAGIYEWSINRSGSGSFTLNTIPRASTFGTVTGNTLGSQITVNINRNVSSFTHQLWYKVNNSIWFDLGTGIGTSKSFTPDIERSYYITNAPTGTMQLCLRTYSGSTQIGSDVYKSIQINVPSSVVPSITNIVTADPNGYNSKYGAFVQTKSKLKVTVESAGVYGSSITKVEITVNGTTYTSNPYISSEIYQSAGTKTVSVKVTDSRGRTATSTKDYTILAYQPPTITGLTARRCDANGNSDDSGAYIKILYAGTVTALQNHNSKEFKLWYREQGSSTWSVINTITNTYTVNSNAIVEADVNKTYDVSFTIKDDFTPSGSYTEKTTKVSTAFTLMDFNSNGQGIAIGKVSEKSALEIAMDVIFTKKMQGIYPVGSIYMTTENTSPSTYFGGTWQRIFGKFLLASSDNYPVGSEGGEATHTLTVDEIPSHSHPISTEGGTVGHYEYIAGAGGSAGTSGASRTSTTGGGVAHNNMPPYLSVYVWKRTA